MFSVFFYNGKQNHFIMTPIKPISSRKKYTLMRSICDNDLLASALRIDNLKAAGGIFASLPKTKELHPTKPCKSHQLELNSFD